MNVNKWITVLGTLVLLTVLGFYMCSFQVRFTEVAVKKRFGKFTEKDIMEKPGLYFKWPWPLETKITTDKRVRILEDTTEETQTRDGINVIVATYTCWKVADPMRFHIASNTVDDAQSKLREMVRSKKKIVVARHDLSNFVSTDQTEFKFEQIEKEMLAEVSDIALGQYGIAVPEFGIRRLSFPESVSEQVLERMKKREEARAAKFLTEGKAEAQDIRAQASAISENILAVTNRLAENIEAQANQEVADYYKEFEKNVELRLFLDQLKVSQEVLRERTTLVLDTVMAPFGLIDLDKIVGEEKTKK